jgi:hypothetical protein
LVDEEKKLEDLPITIATMQDQKNSIAERAQALREQEQPIPGSADADCQDILEAYQLRLDLINASTS